MNHPSETTSKGAFSSPTPKSDTTVTVWVVSKVKQHLKVISQIPAPKLSHPMDCFHKILKGKTTLGKFHNRPGETTFGVDFVSLQVKSPTWVGKLPSPKNFG